MITVGASADAWVAAGEIPTDGGAGVVLGMVLANAGSAVMGAGGAGALAHALRNASSKTAPLGKTARPDISSSIAYYSKMLDA
jgi:hypothetical protein